MSPYDTFWERTHDITEELDRFNVDEREDFKELKNIEDYIKTFLNCIVIIIMLKIVSPYYFE